MCRSIGDIFWNLLQHKKLKLLKQSISTNARAFICPVSKVIIFIWIYKRYEPSFWSKEKDYSVFIRPRQYTVFTTDYHSNRGLFISVHSVWYIYNIAPYNTVLNDSHSLLTRKFSLPVSHISIMVSKLMTKMSIIWKVF